MSFSKEELFFIESLLTNNKLPLKVKTLRSIGNNDHPLIDDIETLLSGARMTSDRARFFRDGINITDKISTKGTNKNGNENYYIRNDKLNNQLLLGGTFVIDSINEFKGYFSSTTYQLSELLQCESSANLYVSYGNLIGFGDHKDDHHVLVKQLAGEKRWRFSHAINDIILKPGNLLFVPKGVSHNPISESNKSFHVTYSIVKPSLFEFIKWASSASFLDNLKNYSIEDEIAYKREIDCLFKEFIKYQMKKYKDLKSYNKKRMFP